MCNNILKRKRFPDQRRYSWIAVGVAAVGVVGGAISRGKANKKLSKLQQQAEANKYTENPLAQKRLDLANTLLNSRMPGASQAERNIYATGANQQGIIRRNATSGTQALALGAGMQAQEGEQFNQLAQLETGDYQRRLANQENAQQGVINEGDKVQGSKENVLGQTAQIQGAQSANNANTWQSVSNLGFSAANFGMQGGFNSGMGESVWGKPNPYKNDAAWGNAAGMQRTTPYNPQTLPYHQ